MQTNIIKQNGSNLTQHQPTQQLKWKGYQQTLAKPNQRNNIHTNTRNININTRSIKTRNITHLYTAL